MSHADTIRLKNKVLAAKIQTLTGISSEDLGELKFNSAYSYLEEILETDDYGMEVIPKTKQFWAWWSIEWGRIDQIFFNNIKTGYRHGLCQIDDPFTGNLKACYNQQDLLNYYLLYHEISEDNLLINAQVMDASCHQMIMEITGSVKFFNEY